MKLAKPLLAAVFALAASGAQAQGINAAGQDALENARSGTVVQWRNPDDGAVGTFVPKPAFQSADGQVCREFNQTVTIGGQQQQAWGTACRQADGSWKLQRAATAEAPPPQPRYIPAPPAPVTVYAPPPPVVYTYSPVYFPPGYYYARPYYTSSIFIGVGGPRRHHRHW
jgi:hypothetical protein